jgi:hypothetical protein
MNEPQFGSMSAAEMRAAQAAYDETRGQVLLDVKATSVDVAAVVGEWRRIGDERRARVRRAEPELYSVLEFLADGWPT